MAEYGSHSDSTGHSNNRRSAGRYRPEGSLFGNGEGNRKRRREEGMDIDGIRRVGGVGHNGEDDDLETTSLRDVGGRVPRAQAPSESLRHDLGSMTFAYGRLVSSTLYAGPTSPTSRWFSPHKLAPRPIPKARQTRTNSIESLNPSARGAESGVVSDVHSDQRGNRGTNTRGANRPATRIDPNQDQAAGDCDDTRPEFTVKIRSGHTMANPLEALRKLDSYLDQVEAHRLFYLKAPGLGYLVKMTRPEKERLRGLCPKTLRVVITEEPPLFAQ